MNTAFDGNLNEIDINTSNNIKQWIKKHFIMLSCAVLISDSLYGGIAFLNSNLFGLRYFSMNLTDIQLERFKPVNKRKLFVLSIVNFIIHLVAIWYVFSHESQYDDMLTIKATTMMGIVCNIFVLCTKCSTIYRDEEIYKVKRFEIVIECDNGRDIKQIRRI